MYFELFQQFQKTLGQMETWLHAAETHAKANNYPPSDTLELRLIADQLPFARQVQIACDTAKMGAAALSGKTAPVHDDNETSLEQLRGRLANVRAYLGTYRREDFAGATERKVSQARWEGKWMTGQDYFLQHVTPNFFFHATTAYALLRHKGVALGKKDYLGERTMRLPE
jgi:uncharacterized protein